jgi:membrane protein DedA with SNARE-associated domain
MNSVLGPILSYILLYKYPFLFIVQFISALIVPFPANTALVAVGAFASEGYMSLWLSFAIALAGNIAGDATGYWIARGFLVRKSVMRYFRGESRKGFSNYVGRLERGLRRYLGRTVFITRFTPALQSIINILAGLAEAPFKIFLIADIVGNTFNVLIYLCAGWFIGVNWEDIAGVFGVAGGILLVIVLIVIVGWIYKNVAQGQMEEKIGE